MADIVFVPLARTVGLIALAAVAFSAMAIACAPPNGDDDGARSLPDASTDSAIVDSDSLDSAALDSGDPYHSPCLNAGFYCVSTTPLPSGGGPTGCSDFYYVDVPLACAPNETCCTPPMPACLDGGALPFTTADLENDLGNVPLKPPRAPQSVCSDSDRATFNMNLAEVAQRSDGGVVMSDGGGPPGDPLTQGIAPACAACLVSKITDTNWGPVVELQDPNNVLLNVGACYASVNDSVECGQAVNLARECGDRLCGEACPSDGSCFGFAISPNGPCWSYEAAARASCPEYGLAGDTCGDGTYALFGYFCGWE